MANAETSYADRHARACVLQAEIAEFDPVFAPQDESLGADGFAEFCGEVQEANVAAGTTLDAWRTVVGEREALVKTMKATATRVLAYLKSSAAFAGRLKIAKSAADKLRGIRPKKPKAPEGEEPPVEKKRNLGDQSYGDIALHFEALKGAVTGLPGYAPVPTTNPITVSNLNQTQSTFRSKNSAIITLARAWREKVRARLEIFDGEEGLRVKMIAIKNAVKAQYGQDSDEYAAVKGIKV